MNLMRTSTFSTPLADELAIQNYLMFIPQTSPGTYYLPRYVFNSPIFAGTYHGQRVPLLH